MNKSGGALHAEKRGLHPAWWWARRHGLPSRFIEEQFVPPERHHVNGRLVGYYDLHGVPQHVWRLLKAKKERK